jgi:hypothetical protein
MADRCACASTWPYFKQRSDDGLEVGLNFSGDFLEIVNAAPKPRKASWEGVTIHAQKTGRRQSWAGGFELANLISN